jgi:hypothetical protein
MLQTSPFCASHRHSSALAVLQRHSFLLAARLFDGLQDSIGVAFDMDFREDPRDPALRVDHERRALDSQVLNPIKSPLSPYAERLGRLMFRVGQQAERQAEFRSELQLRLDRIGADADDDGIGRLELSLGVAKRLRLLRSTGRTGFRVEEQRDGLAAQVGKRNLLSILVQQADIRRGVSQMQHRFSFRFRLLSLCGAQTPPLIAT